MNKNIPIILFLAVYAFSCNSSKQTSSPKNEQEVNVKTAPNWVNQRPLSSIYYIGIGIASKRVDPVNYADIAKRNALNDLSSEISVSISSNSVLYTLEKNDRFREDYLNTTKLKASRELQGYEIYDAFEDDERYYVYYRLSKADYLEQKMKKENQAKQAAINNIDAAENSKSRGQYASALLSYARAFADLEGFLNENLDGNIHGQQVFLGNEINKRFRETWESIQLEMKDQYSIYYGQSLSSRFISIRVLDENKKPIRNIPYTLSIHGKVVENVVSSENGSLIFDLTEKVKLERQLSMTFSIDSKQIFNDYIGNNPIKRAFVNQLSSNSSTTKVIYNFPKVLVQIENPNANFRTGENSLISGFNQHLQEVGYTLVNQVQKADLIIKLNVVSRYGQETFGMHSAVLDVNVLVEKSNEAGIFYSYSASDIRGLHLDKISAVNKGYEVAADKLRLEFLPAFNQQVFR